AHRAGDARLSAQPQPGPGGSALIFRSRFRSAATAGYKPFMDLTVRMQGDAAMLDWGAGKRRTAIGPGGIAIKRREGDGVTPIGSWPVRGIFFRADRIARPEVTLPLRAIAQDDGWCDAP